MSFSPEQFDLQLDKLTNETHGLITPTGVPDVYALASPQESFVAGARDLVVITGPSGAGKDSIIEDIMSKNSNFTRVKTASTRARRPDEHADAMTWMRSKHDNETDQEYLDDLVDSYGLIEYSVHHGDVYGLPARNLRSLSAEEMPLLNTDPEGIVSLRRSLGGEYDMTSIMVCPQSAGQLQERLKITGRYSLGRLATAQAYIEAAPATASFVLVNREADSTESAISQSGDKVLQLLISNNIIEERMNVMEGSL